MPSPHVQELFTTHLDQLTDPRLDRTKRHELLDILVLAVCGTLGGAHGWADIARFATAKRAFFGQFLDLPHGVPSHDTFGRVFALLDPAALLACIQKWLAQFRAAVDRALVAIDGKTLRGSFDTAAGQQARPLASAWASQARLVLGQVAVDQKSNEITAIPALLELLDLKGSIVTIDAMGCRTEIAKAIRAQEADYGLAVKDNQPTVHQMIQEALDADLNCRHPQARRCRKVERHRGRTETRE